MSTFDCSASIVVYNNSPEMIKRTIESFLSCSLNVEMHIVDNSKTQILKKLLTGLPVKYHYTDCNLGYGRGHNKVITPELNSPYHLILNPDVVISPSTMESLYSFMVKNPDIGMVCPKVLNADGTIQYLNKRYPTVFDLFARRFIPAFMHRFMQRRLDRYEMKDIGYEDICDIEVMTGCFMFCRTDALMAVGGFDDRYFMYFEDVDLSIKIKQAGYRTVYYPHATVTHLWERSSYKRLKMTFIHMKSAIAYFNKWGWKIF